jgi:hypothetical protein
MFFLHNPVLQFDYSNNTTIRTHRKRLMVLIAIVVGNDTAGMGKFGTASFVPRFQLCPIICYSMYVDLHEILYGRYLVRKMV